MQLTETNHPFISSIVSDLNRSDLTKEQWFDIHSKCVAAKHLGSKLVRFSREKAAAQWGVEFVADSEVQIEMDLGVNFLEEAPSLNPNDRSTGIVTLEATSSKFQQWRKKMQDEVKSWDAQRIARAKELLKPMVEQYHELERLEAKG